METFTPVPFVYYELLDEARIKEVNGTINFFEEGSTIESGNGRIEEVSKEKDGDFVLLDSGSKIRLDRIITIFGKPGPAYDEYDAYANACMDCMGGMD